MGLGQFFLCAAAACALAIPAQAAGTGYAMLFDAVWKAVNENFYDPAFHGRDWRAIGAQYRARLGTVKTDLQFNALATEMLNELGVSHLYVVPPSTSAAEGLGIGVRFRKLDEKYIVDLVKPLSDARAQGVRTGDLLLWPKTPERLHGALGSWRPVRFESCGGAARNVRVRHISSFWPPEYPDFNWQPYELGAGFTVGYIKIGRFGDAAAGLADQAMSQLKDADAIIIDVRDNSGGNLSEMRLASYFHSGTQAKVALLARDYLKGLGHPVTKADIDAVAHVSEDYTDDTIRGAVRANKGAAVFISEDMGAKRYTKPVAVLIGSNTGSAAEGFAWEMHLASNATLIGQPTAGYLLSAGEFQLPDGWSITIPVQGIWDGSNGADFRDKPVPPDVRVKWTRADLCTGRDPDIEKALAVLSAKHAKQSTTAATPP